MKLETTFLGTNKYKCSGTLYYSWFSTQAQNRLLEMVHEKKIDTYSWSVEHR